jgi:hypothetical protein
MKTITDIQHARAIINEVGEPHQIRVIDMLRSLTYDHSSDKYEREAQHVIDNMEHEYALNVANVLWADKQESIPSWLKTCGEYRGGAGG